MQHTGRSRHSWPRLFVIAVTVLTLAACGRARPPVNAATPGLYAPTLEVLENSSGQGVTQVDLVVSLRPARQNSVSVNYRLVDGSATRGVDYLADADTGTLTFAPGETEKTVRVEIVDDDLYEGAGEDFSLVLSGAQGADIIEGSGVITIKDDDRMPFAYVDVGAPQGQDGVSVNEAQAADGSFQRLTVTVRLDIPSGLSTFVPVDTNGDATATPYGDYRLLDDAGNALRYPLAFTFAPGETEKTFVVEIVDDGAVENDEVIVLGVTDNVSGALRRRVDDVEHITIVDDDRPDYNAVTTAPRRRLNDTGVLRYAYHIQNDNDGDGVVDSEADDHTWSEPYLTVSDVSQPTSIVGLSFYDGQDALYGRDAEAVAASGDINQAGFRFVKLGPDGQPLADQTAIYQDTPWHCVRDEVTGLVWEVKVPQGAEPAVHGESQKFYWYEADARANGGLPGQLGLPDCGNGTCAVSTFVAQANQERWCGMSGWRLPTLEELRSIADYGADHNRVADASVPCGTRKDKYGNDVTIYCEPAPLNRAYFPNYNPAVPYWTATPYNGDPSQVWGMRFFGLPTDELLSKGETALVRLVNDGS